MIQFQTVCTLCMVFSIHVFTIQHHERDVNMINMILKRTRSKKLAIGPIGPMGPNWANGALSIAGFMGLPWHNFIDQYGQGTRKVWTMASRGIQEA